MTTRFIHDWEERTMGKSPNGAYVGYPDYEKLVFGLQKIRRYWPGSEQAEVAEAALLSAGEEI